MHNNVRKENGITLIALIITIVILVILAAVSVKTIYDMGIVEQAVKGTERYARASVAEQEEMRTATLQTMIAEYKLKNILDGTTLEGYLEAKGYDVTDNGDGTLSFEEDGYTVTIDEESLSYTSEKATRMARITFMKEGSKVKVVAPGDTVTVSLKFGEEVDLASTKYLYTNKVTVTNEEINTSLPSNSSLEQTIPSSAISTSDIETKYLYLLVAYKGEEGKTRKEETLQVETPGPTATYAFTQDGVNYTWEDLHNMAGIISGMQGIDRTSYEVTITNYNNTGKNVYLSTRNNETTGYTNEFSLIGKIGTGANETNYTYTVRIIGFNSDTLSSKGNDDRLYTNGGTKAGITFEFTNFFSWNGTQENRPMNKSESPYEDTLDNVNTDGWGASGMRGALNDPDTLARLTNSAYIKTVNKNYIKTYYPGELATSPSQDKLWLLAASEVYPYRGINKPTYGFTSTSESDNASSSTDGQYKWYKDNVTGDTSELASAAIKKQTNYTENPTAYGQSDAKFWFLRSPDYVYDSCFCGIRNDGSRATTYANGGGYVSPCFCI